MGVSQQAVEKGAECKKCKTKTVKSEPPPKKYNQFKSKAIQENLRKIGGFHAFRLSSSAVPLYADELEMTKSAAGASL